MKQTLYSVRRSKRAKRIRITVYHNGNVVVTGPADVSPSILERCVSDNISWITDKINFFKSFGNLATLAFFLIITRNTGIRHSHLLRAVCDSIMKYISFLTIRFI